MLTIQFTAAGKTQTPPLSMLFTVCSVYLHVSGPRHACTSTMFSCLRLCLLAVRKHIAFSFQSDASVHCMASTKCESATANHRSSLPTRGTTGRNVHNASSRLKSPRVMRFHVWRLIYLQFHARCRTAFLHFAFSPPLATAITTRPH